MAVRRVAYLAIVFVLVGLSLTLTVPLTLGQDGEWTETFDDPALPGWEHSPGALVVNGVLRIEPGIINTISTYSIVCLGSAMNETCSISPFTKKRPQFAAQRAFVKFV